MGPWPLHRKRKACPSHVEHVLEFAPELGVPHDVRHDADLEDGDEGRDLEEARGADGAQAVDGCKAVGEGHKRVAAPVDVPGEVEAVLELDVAEAVKGLLVGLVEETELALEGREGRGGPGGPGQGEGGGGGDKGGEESGRHCDGSGGGGGGGGDGGADRLSTLLCMVRRLGLKL